MSGSSRLAKPERLLLANCWSRTSTATPPSSVRSRERVEPLLTSAESASAAPPPYGGYLDTSAAQPRQTWRPPSPEDVAAWLRPGAVFRTVELDGRLVRNHAKFLLLDHRFLLVTSANFSRSAEFHNVELGVKIDSPGLAESVQREIRVVEDRLYERVPAG